MEPNSDGPNLIARAPARIPIVNVVASRFFFGFIVLVCAEVFSGASVKVGLWNPWTWVMTYWLYFAHFYFFTTLAVRTGRTSLGSLYLWGVLYGLYESWITKVVWSGYNGDGKFAMGAIGPFGFSEISMVFFFHPIAAFILPLATACIHCPSLRRHFSSLAWLTGSTKTARAIQVYLVFSFAPAMAVNSGGLTNLTLNLMVVLVLLFVLWWLARPALEASDGVGIVAFANRGFAALAVYLAMLYGVTYVYLRPEALPSLSVQVFTFVFYGVAIAGLRLYPRRAPLPAAEAHVEKREVSLIETLFALIVVLALVLSNLAGQSVLFLALVPIFISWTLLGFVLAAAALVMPIHARLTREAS
ncbi:MAG: hypothetical protein WC655_09095 [Candidatus Hydrogenedentales bacterium]|jgi:hypothetical protein